MNTHHDFIASYNIETLLKITNGQSYHTQPDKTFTGISTDTRTIKANNIYIALIGPRYDGHDFVNMAMQKGASLCIVEHDIAESIPYLKVKNSFQALQKIAQYQRQKFKGKIIGITGSVGKTTLRESLKMILAGYGRSFSSLKNYNNHLGVPISLSNLPENSDYGIFEMGMNAPHEIVPLTTMIKPDIACITEIGPAHIGNFNSLEELALTKAEIFDGLSNKGTAIYNGDNQFASFLENYLDNKEIHHRLSFGTEEKNDIALKAVQKKGRLYQITVQTPDGQCSYNLPCDKRPILYTSLAMIATLYSLQLTGDQKYIPSFENICALSGRGQEIFLTWQGLQLTILDDSYNANPLSMKAAIENLKNSNHNGRKIAILGDMLELGEHKRKYHDELCPLILETKADIIILCGPEMKFVCEHLKSKLSCHYFESPQDIPKSFFRKNLQNNDLILVKGSRGMEMEKAINTLRADNDFKNQRNCQHAL